MSLSVVKASPYRIEARNTREAYESALREVVSASDRLSAVIKEHLEISEEMPKEEKKRREAFLSEMHTGHDNPFAQKGEPAKHKGLQGEDCRVFASQYDNVEGSYYAEFDGNQLRLRGYDPSGQCIYLDGNENLLLIQEREPKFVYLDGATMTESDGKGLRGITKESQRENMKAYLDYQREYKHYQREYKQWEEVGNSIRGFIERNLKGKKDPEPQEPEPKPEPAKAEVIPFSIAVEKLRLISDGITRMAQTIEERATNRKAA